MKSNRYPILTVALLVAAAFCPVSHGELEEIGVLVEYIDIDEPSATKLLRKYRGKRDLTPMRDELRERIDKGEARITSTAFVRTLSGQRVSLQAVDEIIYPTDFDPPETKRVIKGPIPKGETITIPARPAEFMRRAVGVELELDPVAGADGETIELNIAPELSHHLGDRTHGKDESEITQPIFYSLRTTTAITIRSGEYTLLGVHTPHRKIDGKEKGRPDKTRRCLVFVRGTIEDDSREGGSRK